MKWIVLAIVLCVVPYTIVTLYFRKPGPAFRPYEDMKNRANVSRLLAAGYRRIPLTAQRPADGLRVKAGAAIASAPGGVPADLRATLVEEPVLPVEITTLAAPAAIAAGEPYAIQFSCQLPDTQHQLGGADLYLRGNELVFTPTFERIPGNLHARAAQTAVLLTVPGDALKSGRYTVTLLGQRTSRTWPLEVRP